MKRIIRLNESGLTRLITESVKALLYEMSNDPDTQQAQDLIKQHNSTAVDSGSYFIIAVTGQLQKYYTLYFYSKPIADFGKANPYIYKQNLSQSFTDAVQKLLAKGIKCPIQVFPEGELLDKIQKYKASVFHSGKYQGKSYEEVYNTDPKYIIWYVDKLKEEATKPKKMPYSNRIYYLSKSQAEMLEALEPYVKTYHEEQIQLRRDTIVSEHIPDAKVSNITFTITHTPVLKDGNFGTYLQLRGKEGNRYFIVNAKPLPGMNNNMLDALKGATVFIQSAKCEPTEIYGVKYNRLSYVKGLTIN